MDVPLGKSDWLRAGTQVPEVGLVNRYFEENPVNAVNGATLLARPSLAKYKTLGNGPIRGMFTSPGAMKDAMFVASGPSLFRIAATDVVSLLSNTLAPGGAGSRVRFSMSAALGTVPSMLFITDGSSLQLFMDNSYATGVLTASGAILTGDTIQIGSVFYRWTSGSVNAGTPLGTVAAPWLVQLLPDNAAALDNMRSAISNTGVPGTSYSLALVVNPAARSRGSTTNQLFIQAIDAGAAGNAIVTTKITGANFLFGAATLANGGGDSIVPVPLPDGFGAIDVAHINGYTIVIPFALNEGVAGRFFWIAPGETFIRPLAFSRAERAPDTLRAVRVVGDQIWLFGDTTTEFWYPSGDVNQPFIRQQGQLFDRGIVSGTDAQVKGSVIVLDKDGTIYALSGGAPERISNHAIESLARLALKQFTTG